MKVADLVATDNKLLTILQRLGIRLGFGEVTVQGLCNSYDISTDLFLEICNICTYRCHEPQTSALNEHDIKKITTYLRASHKYYSEHGFPTIHNKIHMLVEELDNVSRRLIDRFYDDYDSEVNNHLKYEEEVVFPYIETVLKKSDRGNMPYKISKFEENHSNINEKLNDLKNIIIKYLPEEHATALRYEILSDIYTLENDLRLHSLIENKLLIPLVEIMEKHNG